MVLLHISKLDGVWGVVEDILRQKRSDILIVDDSSVSSDEMQKADVVITYRFDWHLFRNRLSSGLRTCLLLRGKVSPFTITGWRIAYLFNRYDDFFVLTLGSTFVNALARMLLALRGQFLRALQCCIGVKGDWTMPFSRVEMSCDVDRGRIRCAGLPIMAKSRKNAPQVDVKRLVWIGEYADLDALCPFLNDILLDVQLTMLVPLKDIDVTCARIDRRDVCIAEKPSDVTTLMRTLRGFDAYLSLKRVGECWDSGVEFAIAAGIPVMGSAMLVSSGSLVLPQACFDSARSIRKVLASPMRFHLPTQWTVKRFVGHLEAFVGAKQRDIVLPACQFGQSLQLVWSVLLSFPLMSFLLMVWIWLTRSWHYSLLKSAKDLLCLFVDISPYGNLRPDGFRVSMWATIITFVVFVAFFRHVSKRLKDAKQEVLFDGRRNDLPGLLDEPITWDGADEVGRNHYVQSLLAQIHAAPHSRGSQYIGMYAKWGEGKTSVYNLLQDATCDTRLLFVYFGSWNYSGCSDISRLFFYKMADVIEKKLTGKADWYYRLGRTIADHTGLSSLENVPIVGQLFISWVTRGYDPDVIKCRLKKALLHQNRRVVVGIDDIDRLPAERIFEVLRLLKANGDLPNVTYLVMADKDYLAKMIDAHLFAGNVTGRQSGLSFIEKIITEEVALPEVSLETIIRMFSASLKEIRKDFPGFESLDTRDEDLDIIFRLIPTLRARKRGLASVRATLVYQAQKARAIGVKYPDVCFSDLVVLTMVRLRYPTFCDDVYDRIRRLFPDVGSVVNSRKVESELMVGVSENEKPFLYEVLHKVLGVARVVSTAADVCRREAPSVNDSRAFKIKDWDYLDNYFCGQLVRDREDRIQKSDHICIKDSLSKGVDVCTSELTRIVSKKKCLRDLLDQFTGIQWYRRMTHKERFDFILSIAGLFKKPLYREMAERYQFRFDMLSNGFGVYASVLRCVRSVLDEVPQPHDKRSEQLMEVFRQCDISFKSLFCIDEIARRNAGESDKTCMLTRKHLKELASGLLGCLKSDLDFGKIYKRSNEGIVRRAVHLAVEFLGEETYCRLYALRLQMEAERNCKRAVRTLWPCLYANRKVIWNDGPLCVFVHRSMISLYPCKLIHEQLRRIAEKNLFVLLPHEVSMIYVLETHCEASENQSAFEVAVQKALVNDRYGYMSKRKGMRYQLEESCDFTIRSYE